MVSFWTGFMQSTLSVIVSIGNVVIGKLLVFMFKVHRLDLRNVSARINDSPEKKAIEGILISKNQIKMEK